MKLAPRVSGALRQRHHGPIGNRWYVDETYIRMQGHRCYLYRAIDRDGHLIDARLSDTRDLVAAEAFLRSAWTATEVTPDRITTDGHDAYPRAIRNVFGHQVTPPTNRYLNNHLERHHRSIKQRSRPMCGFKTFGTAEPFCCFFDEMRTFFQPRSRHNQHLSLSECRRIHRDRFAQLMGIMAGLVNQARAIHVTGPILVARKLTQPDDHRRAHLVDQLTRRIARLGYRVTLSLSRLRSSLFSL